ncbi:hypothetical protein [Halomicrobium urmianum]|uniref:hypothetical protein n=1 Tax=Halomicrobium urmianum TaxID=1586233 RepID=UPI001CD9C236|nr:hypothetical protein [Halomicrobium urmianum]
MQTESIAVYGVAALIVATALASGPLVGGVDFTQSQATTGLGEGSATVANATLPADVAFEGGRFGTEGYRLSVPPADVEFASITGRPVLAYRVVVPALDYARVSSSILSPDNEGRFAAQFEGGTVDRERIDCDRYDGRLELLLRSGTDERTVATRRVVIEVVG